MKRNIFFLATIMSVALATSCSDFLDQSSPSEISRETVSDKPYYAGQRINSLYGRLTQDQTYSQYIPIGWSANTDIEMVNVIDSNKVYNADLNGYAHYNVGTSVNKVEQMWNQMYVSIEDANLAVDDIRNSQLFKDGDATMRRYLGEALTIRALLYYDMVKIYGDIPFRFEASKDDRSNTNPPKSDRDIILDSLMNSLDEAIEYLPWAYEVADYTTERVTKGYAHALLGQLALTRAGWVIREAPKAGYETASDGSSDATYPTQRPDAATRHQLYERALKHFAAVITSGKHAMNPSFENEWYLLNQLQLDRAYRENLFEIPMGMSTSGELGYVVGVRFENNAKYGRKNTANSLMTNAAFLYSYDPDDERRQVTVAGISIDENGVERLAASGIFGLNITKWDVRKMSSAWVDLNIQSLKVEGDKTLTGINVVKMRYPQVLLYYAEALNELAGPDARYDGDAGITARQALEQVHSRAFRQNLAKSQQYIAAIPGDKDSFFEALVQENAWELCGEGFRKYDLIRWNLLAQKIWDMKQDVLRETTDGTYQEEIYYNYTAEDPTVIDPASITWYGLPAGKTKNDYDNTKQGLRDRSFGYYKNSDTATKNLRFISCGLVGTSTSVMYEGVEVKNRYLMPLYYNTIGLSEGVLKNSYGIQ